MDIKEVFEKRKSIRKYKAQEVEDEKLKQCLQAFRLAPSACNLQPYKVFILKGKAKDDFCKKVFTGAYSACSFAAKAPIIIAVASSKKTFTGWAGNQIQGTDFPLIDIGIAGEHFILEAAALGLGTCWLGWFSKKEADKALKLGIGEKTEILISLGYPDEEPKDRPRKKEEELFFFKEDL
ncbi:MAG: nitroreductase family protein [Elusimicrobiota bacterium]